VSTQILDVQDIETQLRMGAGMVHAINKVLFTTGEGDIVESWAKATAGLA